MTLHAIVIVFVVVIVATEEDGSSIGDHGCAGRGCWVIVLVNVIVVPGARVQFGLICNGKEIKEIGDLLVWLGIYGSRGNRIGTRVDGQV